MRLAIAGALAIAAMAALLRLGPTGRFGTTAPVDSSVSRAPAAGATSLVGHREPETGRVVLESVTAADAPRLFHHGSATIEGTLAGLRSPVRPHAPILRASVFDIDKGRPIVHDLAVVDAAGSFRIEHLPAGHFRVWVSGDNRMRVPPVTLDVEEGQTHRLQLTAAYAVPTELMIKVTDRSGSSAALRRGTVTITEDPEGYHPAAVQVIRRTISGSATTLHLVLFPSRHRIDATFGTSATSVVLPTPRTQATFTVPVDVGSPQIEVPLVVEPVRHQALVAGRILLADGDIPYGFKALAEAPGGASIETRLKLAPDGSFRLRVDLDRISGPQIVIESRRHADRAGPFVLAEGAIDLGDLRFQDRAEDEEDCLPAPVRVASDAARPVTLEELESLLEECGVPMKGLSINVPPADGDH